MRSGVRVGAVWVLTATLGACSQSAAPPDPQLWTLADVEARRAAGASNLAAKSGLPGGISIDQILSGSALFQRSSFADGYGTFYVTTEIWSGFDRVWTQPMYVPVTGWSNGAPQVVTDPQGGWHPVFSVGAGSAFYSPFWQTIYFDVPAGTATDTFTSAKQILDAGLALHPREGRTISIVPSDIISPTAAPAPGAGWVDGVKVSDIDFGEQLFTWDDANVVAETPLFVWVTRDAEGNLQPVGIPTVGGTGPVGSHSGAARVIDGQPRYAGYWRLYTVEVPSGARVFADSTLQAALQSEGLAPDPAVDPTIVTDFPNAVGRVALDPTCFGSVNTADPTPGNGTSGACLYLDSQAHIEDNVDPSAIQPTDITVTCPFVTFQYGVNVSPIL